MPVTLTGSSPTFLSGYQGGVLTSGTAVSASGTAVNFTGIPSWVKRITVMFSGVSLSGASEILIQLGAGSVTTSGYVSGGLAAQSSAVSSGAFTSTSGLLASAGLANTAYIVNGSTDILNINSNTWVSRSVLVATAGSRGCLTGGSIALSGTLDRVRVTTVNGTDTFDAGTINIMYEG
jgi:hypothetical protein